MGTLDRATSSNAIGLGLAALGRPAYINLGRDNDLGPDRSETDLRSRTYGVLDAAWDSGVRYFDAARSYGLAETFLAEWLEMHPGARAEAVIGSKWGYAYTGGWLVDERVQERQDLSVEAFRRQLAQTRVAFDGDVDLYQIHSATVRSGVLDDRELLDQLEALRATGVAIGVTVTGVGQADTIDRAVDIGIFDVVQATWNLLERSAGPALSRAHAAGLGVIVKEPVANGRLATRGSPAVLRKYARDKDVSPDVVAIAAVLSQPWVDIVLSGAVDRQMLASNLLAADLVRAGVCPADDLTELCTDAEAYWRYRSGLPWA